MTPSTFIRKWKASNLKERSAAQEHFIDLCRLLGEQTPVEADPNGASYCFERGASLLSGGDGWADVWKRGHFSDDTIFGILHSRFHELWSLPLEGWHGAGNDPQYTPSAGFETFPFPEGLTPNIPAKDYADDPRAQKIAAAAKRLDRMRNHWLNPPDLVVRVPEVVKGYPDRILPKNEAAAQVLKQRTLTNLDNERPAWLDHVHRHLDEAVANAYGWQPDMSDDEMLTKLLALNLERAREYPGLSHDLQG